ncbi:MAG: PAS domain-containing protein [Bacteroidota bacterium]
MPDLQHRQHYPARTSPPDDAYRTWDELHEEVQRLRSRLSALERLQVVGEGTNLYRLLMEHFPGGLILLFDPHLRFLVAEGEGLNALGLLKHAVVGHTLEEVFPDLTHDLMAPAFHAALQGTPSTETVQHGDRRFLTRVAPIRNKHGDVVAGMMVTQDVTHLESGE